MDNLNKINMDNAASAFEMAAKETHAMPDFSGNGIVIAAGGLYLPSAYVVVRLLRNFSVKLPIEIWHAGKEEKPDWAEKAFKQWNVEFRDIMEYCPDRPLKQLRGWPIKPAAILHSSFRCVLFLDADCFPLRNLEFLFDTAQFQKYKALFWPDFKFFRLVENSQIWELTNLQYQGDREFESGILLLDKQANWKELCLTEWMGAHSDFWYGHTLGDKNTFYLSWRKLNRPYFLAPGPKRFPMCLIRHYWVDGLAIVDHRAGASRYTIPFKKWFFKCYSSPYKWRPKFKNIFDEMTQRFIVRNFKFHTRCLNELKLIYEKYHDYE